LIYPLKKLKTDFYLNIEMKNFESFIEILKLSTIIDV
jgi:hypothetical protein